MAGKIEKKKLELAKRIIAKSKKLGYYKRMSNNQYPRPELLATSHTLPELRKTYEQMKKA